MGGKNYLDQIQKIQEVLGTPSKDETTFILNPKARAFLESLPNQPRKPWVKMYPRAEGTPGAFDLLDKLLSFDPRKRITVEEALAHTYMAAYYDPSDEPFTFDMEFDDLPTQQLKKMVHREVEEFVDK